MAFKVIFLLVVGAILATNAFPAEQQMQRLMPGGPKPVAGLPPTQQAGPMNNPGAANEDLKTDSSYGYGYYYPYSYSSYHYPSYWGSGYYGYGYPYYSYYSRHAYPYYYY